MEEEVLAYFPDNFVARVGRHEPLFLPPRCWSGCVQVVLSSSATLAFGHRTDNDPKFSGLMDWIKRRRRLRSHRW